MRKKVAQLIREVLIGKICVREAINQFPHDIEDESIQASYHALVHYEADEDLRKRDLLYKEEQDSYLMMIAEILESGEDLPFNIINSYKEYYKSANIPQGNDFKGKLKSFFKMLNV
ncbi:MAG: hypothetical protein NC390_04450 [Fusobacterium sp.]|nr:hypothetical protein [Fusobacterium sp.]